MLWQVFFFDAFAQEFRRFDPEVQDELLACASLLQRLGPELGRPRVDTLKGSIHRNMKELRFDAKNGVWRVAFAFDPERCAILLCAGSKQGRSQERFYKSLINKADERFQTHLDDLARRKQNEIAKGSLRLSPPRKARKNKSAR
jgi:hypothetical protein